MFTRRRQDLLRHPNQSTSTSNTIRQRSAQRYIRLKTRKKWWTITFTCQPTKSRIWMPRRLRRTGHRSRRRKTLRCRLRLTHRIRRVLLLSGVTRCRPSSNRSSSLRHWASGQLCKGPKSNVLGWIWVKVDQRKKWFKKDKAQLGWWLPRRREAHSRVSCPFGTSYARSMATQALSWVTWTRRRTLRKSRNKKSCELIPIVIISLKLSTFLKSPY